MIITTFNKQLNYIKSILKDTVNVLTIDRSQGCEAKIVILSLSVNSNGSHQLINDIQRLNVAMSRAQCKLIIVGSESKLEQFPEVQNLLQNIKNLSFSLGIN